jgi:hypothetical protein
MSERKTKPRVHSEVAAEENVMTEEKTFIKALGLGGVGGVPCAVDVKSGKIVRIRPLHFDWKYDKKDFSPWKIKARGKVLEACMKTQPAPEIDPRYNSQKGGRGYNWERIVTHPVSQLRGFDVSRYANRN